MAEEAITLAELAAAFDDVYLGQNGGRNGVYIRDPEAFAGLLFERALRDRDRTPDSGAEAQLAAIYQTVVDEFLGMFGTSTLASFAPAIKLAWSVRKILGGSGVAAREAIAEAERERLLELIATRFKVVMTYDNGYRADAVPWASLLDVLRGLPSVGLEEVPDGAGQEQALAEMAAAAAEPEHLAPAGDPREILGRAAHAMYYLWWNEQPQPKVPFWSWDRINPEWRDLMMRIGAAVAGAEQDRIFAALAALKVTFTRPGFGFKTPVNVDVVPWEAVVKMLGGETPGEPGAAGRMTREGNGRG